jgi:hypothetical protein
MQFILLVTTFRESVQCVHFANPYIPSICTSLLTHNHVLRPILLKIARSVYYQKSNSWNFDEIFNR